MTKRYFKQPFTLPLGTTMLGWLFADRIHMAGAWMGAFWTIIALIWIVSIVSIVVFVGLIVNGVEALGADEIEQRLAALEARR